MMKKYTFTDRESYEAFAGELDKEMGFPNDSADRAIDHYDKARVDKDGNKELRLAERIERVTDTAEIITRIQKGDNEQVRISIRSSETLDKRR